MAFQKPGKKEIKCLPGKQVNQVPKKEVEISLFHLVTKVKKERELPIRFQISLKKFTTLTGELIANKKWDHLKASFTLIEKLLQNGDPKVRYALEGKYVSSLYDLIEYHPAKSMIIKMLPARLAREYNKQTGPFA